MNALIESAMSAKSGGSPVDREGSETVANRAPGVVARRAELGHPDAAADQRHEVREGASRVDPDHGEARGALPAQELFFAGVSPEELVFAGVLLDSVLVVFFDSPPASDALPEPEAASDDSFFGGPLPEPARA